MTSALTTQPVLTGGERCGADCACVAAATVAELQAPVAELRGYLEALARADGSAADSRLLAAARAVSDQVRDVVDTLAAYQETDRAARPQRIDLGSWSGPQPRFWKTSSPTGA